MKRLALFTVLVAATSANACWQLWGGFSTVRNTRLYGQISYEGKPITGAVLELHRARPETDESRRGMTSPGSERKVLKRGRTDSRGRFDFGELLPGKYVVVMSKPSSEEVFVDLAPIIWAQSSGDRLHINYSDDFCQQVIVDR